MDPRNNKGKGVASSQASRPAPRPRPPTAVAAARGEASSSWMRPPPPPPPPQQQQQRPIPPVPGQIPTVGIWDEALRAEPQMRTMDAQRLETLYLPVSGVGRVAASLTPQAPPPRIPPPHQHTAAPAPYYQALLTGLRPPTAPSSHKANSSTSQQLNAMDPRNLHPQHQPPHDAAPRPVFIEAAAAAAPAAEVRGADLAAVAATLREKGAADSPRSRLEEVRSQLRQNPMVLEELAMSPESSVLVVQLLLLQEGGEEMRQCVLDGFVRYAARSIMGNNQGHSVFAALLHSFLERPIELKVIVGAVPNLVWTSNAGMASLKLLITAVGRQPGLPEQLVGRFLREGVMEHARGNELIVHCFTYMDYEATKFLIWHAWYTIGYMLESASGLARLDTCLRYAGHEECWHFQDIVFEYAVVMAMGRYSNYFVQRVLDHGNIRFRRGLVSKLMEQFAILSLHPYGNYVVQHCVLNKETGSPQLDLLHIVLRACNRLSRRELEALVQTFPATLVLHTLLETGKAVTHCRELTQNVERKINALLSHVRRHRR